MRSDQVAMGFIQLGLKISKDGDCIISLGNPTQQFTVLKIF